ncbi:MAG: MYG1 family protein [Chlamydiota bacterium]
MHSSIIQASFGTHDGSFHADEVTACSLLLLFGCIDRDKIYRTRDAEKLDRCDYVCDVGGLYDPGKKRFDHHQAGYKGPLSSAGMILQFLKDRQILDPDLYDHYNKSLISGVDAHDNGIAKLEPGITSFSQVVSNFLPIEYDTSPEEMTQAFFQAVDFVIGHLDRIRKRHFYTLDCRATVKKKMAGAGNVMIFEESLPWMDNFFDLGGEVHPAQFVIMPAGNHWKLRGIPPNLNERMKVRCPLPLDWAGLHEDELQRVSGIEGAIFCHKGRFISIWETKEDAIKALHIALKKG